MRNSSSTVGVISRIAASFDSAAATSADSAKVTRKACFTGPRVRGSIIAARRVNRPRRSAADVIVITAASVM